MSVEQFSALLAQLQADPGLKEKLSGAADLDAALAIAKDAGFDVTPDDLNNDQASQGSISAEELAAISGGKESIKEIAADNWKTAKEFRYQGLIYPKH